VEKVNAKKIDLSAITSGTSDRGAEEKGWIFNLEFFQNIKKQGLTPERTHIPSTEGGNYATVIEGL